MKDCLDQNKVDYVLHHLKQHVVLNDGIINRFNFLNIDAFDKHKLSNQIIFKVSKEPLDIDKILRIEDIPILYPLSDEKVFYSIDSANNLIFNHDIVKSAFHLLSGYQEILDYEPDAMGRFTHKASIQHKLTITEVPVVNYYFEAIIKGLQQYSQLNNLVLTKINQQVPFTFLLSHDVDRVDKYDFYQTAFLLKQLLGLSPSNQSKKDAFNKFAYAATQWLKGKCGDNPWWNFTELREIERQYGINSTFYFLPKHTKHLDAYYDLNEPRIKELIQLLIDEGCEVGFHAPVAASQNFTILSSKLKELSQVCTQKIVGNRQHTLANKYPDTQILLEKAGLLYDTTLGFAEHEGFRNSYCFPFHPYDFYENKMMELWEIPLVLMDCSLFKYQNLSIQEAHKRVDNLITQITKFNGIFSLLWHNSYFEEDDVPGIGAFYNAILERITKKRSQNVTGIACIKQYGKQ